MSTFSANSGIGYEMAKYFAKKGAYVFLCSRTISKGEMAKSKINQEAPHARIDVIPLDLSDALSIDSMVNIIKQKTDRIDILCNNAGIMGAKYTLTKDGFESQMGVNHLGHFRLTGQLLDMMNDQSRIVNVSSMAYLQGRINQKNFMFEHGQYSPFASYSRSKLANVLFTLALSNRIQQSHLDIKVVCAHPGIAFTNLFSKEKQSNLFASLIMLFKKIVPTAADGAKAIIAACMDPNANQGDFYGPYRSKKYQGDIIKLEKLNAIAANPQNQAFLWEYSTKKTGVNYPV